MSKLESGSAKISADPQKVRAQSEALIRAAGGKVCDWLPIIERPRRRSPGTIIGRALVMNALANIHFGAPTESISDWLRKSDLTKHLSRAERLALKKPAGQWTERERTNMYWYLEGLWTFLWIGGLVDELPFQKPLGDETASLCPDVEKGEGPVKLLDHMRIRSADEIFAMLDLYYRLHWWTRDAHLNGYSSEPVSLDIVMERRKALEWCLDPGVDWDDVPDGT